MSDVVRTDESVDRYVIQDAIAGGGMGRIYRGVKKGIGGFEKQVVLKQLLPELTRDPELVELFFREAHIHAALEHANIVHIIDLVSSGNDYFIVMEYVRGTDLYRIISDLRRRSEVLPVSAALFIGREVFKGLDYAHTRRDEQGRPLEIVHRDVSPTNILLSGSGEVKLTDFGIAKSAVDTTGFLNVRGKAAYMSPEQARAEALDHRTDIYSAAVCLYEMIAGSRPLPTFRLGGDPDIHFSQPVRSLLDVRPNCPEELDILVRGALSIDARDRPGSCAEVTTAIEEVMVNQQMFFSSSKLAAYLKSLLGPDPEAWFSGRSYGTPVSASGRNVFRSGNLVSGGPWTGETGGTGRSPSVSDGGDAGRGTSGVSERLARRSGHVGMELTSLSMPDLRKMARLGSGGLPRPARGGRGGVLSRPGETGTGQVSPGSEPPSVRPTELPMPPPPAGAGSSVMPPPPAGAGSSAMPSPPAGAGPSVMPPRPAGADPSVMPPRPAGRGEQVASSVPVSAQPSGVPPAMMTEHVPIPPPPARMPRWVLWSALVVGLALLGGLIFVVVVALGGS